MAAPVPHTEPGRPAVRRAAALAGCVLVVAACWAGAAGALPSPSGSTSSTSSTSSTTSTTSTTPTSIAGTQAAVVPQIAVMGAPAAVTKPAKRVGKAGVLPFPLDPEPTCALLNNFGAARPGGRTHEGTDIIADKGQPILAVADGTLTSQYVDGNADATLSGNAWTLTTADKTYYFYAHLSAFADGLVKGATVKVGQVIGYVGDTGDPVEGAFHLHFEVHPAGGNPVDPVPLLQIPSACTLYGKIKSS